MKSFSLFLLVVSAPISAVSAQPASSTNGTSEAANEQAEPAEQSSERPREERRICRRIGTTGSRTGGQRVCMTADEWRRFEF